MAATTLIDNAVTVTSRHNDSDATASEAATAFVSRDDATRADRSPKPIPETGDRIMVEHPQSGGESPLPGMCQESLSRLRHAPVKRGRSEAR
jgi:hypothetical protein